MRRFEHFRLFGEEGWVLGPGALGQSKITFSCATTRVSFAPPHPVTDVISVVVHPLLPTTSASLPEK